MRWRHRDERERATTEPRLRARRPIATPRAAVGGLLVSLAIVGTFVAHQRATEPPTQEVVVAARDLRIGDVLDSTDLRVVRLDLPTGVGGLFGTIDAAAGRTVLAAVAAGAFLPASSTTDGPAQERFEMVLTAPASRVVDGVRAGERLDVFATWSTAVTELVATSVEVLDVRTGDGDLLSGSGTVLRIAAGDLAQLGALVHAQSTGEVTVVRTPSGATGDAVGRRYPSAGDATGAEAGT